MKREKSYYYKNTLIPEICNIGNKKLDKSYENSDESMELDLINDSISNDEVKCKYLNEKNGLINFKSFNLFKWIMNLNQNRLIMST